MTEDDIRKDEPDMITITTSFDGRSVYARRASVYTVLGRDFSNGDEVVVEGARSGAPRIVSFRSGEERAASAVCRWLATPPPR